MEDIKKYIREVPDFPKPGILFYDITTLLKDSTGLKLVMDRFRDLLASHQVDKVAAIESRGFVFGAHQAYEIGAGFVPVRKPGKLPSQTISRSYDLEYGSGRLDMHLDAIESGDRVLVVDDLIATGGTALATAKLIEECGGTVAGFGFVIELSFLPGRELLKGYDVKSLVTY
jgi:adenine phosphoribosyltransferase